MYSAPKRSRIARDGVANRCEVPANLVCAAGFDFAFEKRTVARILKHAKVRDGFLHVHPAALF